MVMSLVLNYWETKSLSAGCHLLAPRFDLCVSNVQRNEQGQTEFISPSPMRFSEETTSLVPLETFLATALPKLLLSLTILSLNALLLLLRRDTQELQNSTRILIRSLLFLYACAAILTIYAETSLALFLFWEIRIAEQGQECLIVNSIYIGLYISISLHALSLAIDWSLLPIRRYKTLSNGTLPLWLLSIWTPGIIFGILPLTGWHNDFKFCVFLLQFKQNYLRFIGGFHISALLLSILLPIIFRSLLKNSSNSERSVVHSRWTRKCQREQRRTSILIILLHGFCSTPFNGFLLFLPITLPNPLTLHFLFIPTLIPPLIVPLLLAIRAPPPLIPKPTHKNPLSTQMFFIDSTKNRNNINYYNNKQHHFFSPHYLPMENLNERTSSINSYQTTTNSNDSKYGFPIQNIRNKEYNSRT